MTDVGREIKSTLPLKVHTGRNVSAIIGVRYAVFERIAFRITIIIKGGLKFRKQQGNQK